MTGRMSPEERYLRSVYLNYEVCTDVVRHYFDGLHPPTSLVQYLLDQRKKFENAEKKIPNYQWIQLYPEVLFRSDVHIAEKYIDSYERKDLKDHKEFADRINTIFTCLFDSVDGDQKVKVVNLSRLESGEVLASLEITSQYNPDDRNIKQALEATVNSGNVDASIETSPGGFSFAKQGVSDTYQMEINLTKVNAADLAQKDNKEFKIMAKKLERILLILFDTVPGTQSVEVEEFRYLTSDCATAICKLTSEKHADDKRLEEAIGIPTSEGRLGKTLKTTCTPNGFSFKEVIVFEAEITVEETFSKSLENSYSNDFKAFANKAQPIIKGLYDSLSGEQDVEIVKCRKGPSDHTVLVLFHMISHGNNDEEEIRKVTEREIGTGSLSLSHEITADGFKFEPNKCMFEVTLNLTEKYSDSKELANPKSEAFKSFKEKVQPEILRLYDPVCGSQEIDIVKYKSSGAAHSIIFMLTSRGCSDESTLKEPIETQIQTGLLGSNLKVSTSGLTLQKLKERVFYQVSLNVKRQFKDELKKKHSAEFNAFSKFVQTALKPKYEKVTGKQEVNVVECQQGTSGTVSTYVIIEIISQGCTDEVVVRQPMEDLIAVGKMELTLKTSATDFSFKTVRGSKPVSSKCFDLSLLITLIRRETNVKPPKNGFDVLPPKDDISDGAQIATIKHYRNELAHASEAKMDEHKFDSLWSNLENAVRILGKNKKFMKAVCDASTMKLDNSTKEMLIKMVQHDKQLLELEKRVTELYQELYQEIEKLTKQTKEQSASTQAEISGIKEKIRKIEEQILKTKTGIQILVIELHRVENKFDEKFRVQDERNVQQDEMNKNMESGIQENRRDIQRLDTQNERKRILIDQTESRIRKFMEDTKETFVETETQKKVLKILERENCLVMISKGGRGKTTLSLQLASNFRNKGFTPMYVVNNEIETMRDMIDFKSKNFIIVDDLFGQTNANINDHTLGVFYSSVQSENCQSKVMLNIRESPGCNKSILESHSILRETQVINLDDKTYDLSKSEKKKILKKHMKKFNLSLCHCDFSNLMCKESIYTDTDNQLLTVCRSIVEQIIECKTLEGFPEACHMFCNDKTLTLIGLSYFKNTRESLVNTMKNLCAEGFDKNQKKYQYSTLVYVALKGNIDLNYLDESLLLGVLSYYEQKDKKIKKSLVSNAVNDLSLNGKYLVKDREDETYCFQHATICEAVLISYGEECPEDLLPSCSARFFQEYIRPESYRKFKKPNHVYLFVSDELLSNNLLSLFVKKHKFKSAFSGISKKLSELHKVNKMPPTETDNSHSTSNNDTDLDEDQYIDKCGYYEDNTDPGYDTSFIDCSLNPMHHRMIGQYLFDMGIRNKLDSFVNIFLANLSSCFLVTENISPDLMKFFFDGLTFHGKWSEAVSRYFDFCKTYLFKYGSYSVILSFVRPSSNADKCNWTFVPVENALLVKKLIEIFFKTWNCVRDEDEDEVPVRNKCIHVIMECLNQPQPDIMRWHNKNSHLQKIGQFLHSIIKKDPHFVNLILIQLIYITNRDYVEPFIMMYLLDGLTDYGKNFDVISANYDFCKECLFKYGSTPVVLSLCRPSSYKGSDQVIVKIDNQLLANKFLENLKYTDEDFAEFDYKHVPSKNYCYRPCESNIRYFFFEDTDYYDMTYFEDIASYIFSYGVLENDEEFIEAVTTAIDFFENIEEEDYNTHFFEQMHGPIDPITLCRDRLEYFCESFSNRNIRKMKRRFPCLLDSFSMSYSDTDESTSDSDETSDAINADNNENKLIKDTGFTILYARRVEEDGSNLQKNHDHSGKDKSKNFKDGGSN